MDLAVEPLLRRQPPPLLLQVQLLAQASQGVLALVLFQQVWLVLVLVALVA